MRPAAIPVLLTRTRPAVVVGCLAVLWLATLGPVPAARAEDAGDSAEAGGIVLKSLSAEELDVVKDKVGYRLGVRVIEVKPGTPGAAAGIKAQDLLLAVGKTGVDTAARAAAAIRAITGTAEIVAMTVVDGSYNATKYSLTMPGGQPAGDAPAADPLSAYFDLQDFVRTQAWGRQVATGPEERQRVAVLLQQYWDQLPVATQGAIAQLPQAWATLRSNWAGWDDATKTREKEAWRLRLLLPSQLMPPPAVTQTYQSEGKMVSFDYPEGWIGAQTEVEGTRFLYLGPPGTETSWDKVLDPPAAPAGALFAVTSLTAEMKALPSYLDGARLLAQRLVTGGGDFKEIDAIPLGKTGAIVTILGRHPGQQEERFYWVGVHSFGPDLIFCAKLGGPTAQAEVLVPAFLHMLSTLQLNPPVPAGGTAPGEVSMAFDAAWSRVSTAVTSAGWYATTH